MWGSSRIVWGGGRRATSGYGYYLPKHEKNSTEALSMSDLSTGLCPRDAPTDVPCILKITGRGHGRQLFQKLKLSPQISAS